MKDYYEILGVSPTSDLVVIRAAFKAMMLKYHPDTNKSPDASDKAKELNEAFAVLSDAQARANYDSGREAETADSTYGSSPTPPPPSPSSQMSDLGSGKKGRSKFNKVQGAYVLGACALATSLIAAFSRFYHSPVATPAKLPIERSIRTNATEAAQLAPLTTANTRVSKTLAVWPLEAASLAPTSLSDLVAEAIPPSEQMGWDSLQTASVRWLSEGIADSATGQANRIGVARVRAAGVVAKMLRQSWVELSWSIELSTSGLSKWGPTSIMIKPGFDNTRFNGNAICFGEGFTGCSFPIDSLKGPRLKLVQQCTISSLQSISIAMSAATLDGRRGTVVYSGSGGSGGWANSVEISALSPQEYCETNKDRGY